MLALLVLPPRVDLLGAMESVAYMEGKLYCDMSSGRGRLLW